LLGIAIDEEHGGMGMDFETLAIMLEQAGRFVAPLPLVPVLVTGALTLQRHASAELAARLLPPMASGQSMLTAALAEVGCDDPRHPSTTAKFDGRCWRLQGHKTAVPALMSCAHVWLSARTVDGVAVFLLDTAAPDVSVQGQKWTTQEHTGQLLMNDAPAELLASGAAADAFLADALLLSRAAYAALALGAAAEMTAMGARYTSDRLQFGRAIATFQSVSHRLADCHIDVECLRGAVTLASNDIARGANSAGASAVIAKIWACDVLHRVSHGVQQVHGGAGLDRDYPLYRYAMLAKSIELACGAAEPLLDELGTTLFAS
jgi:3-oxocholest-4-en-26-oyl-CoA dehydrogenase beta subunit